ncbi:CapA family protein [Thermaerobacter sp. PB12/4term]|uniref:CapA family protein n=1 Tax=Thermaerobacter sp. PB12/4term TaxID=2293838 RepID=UPI000E3290A3|nr:CapA family protein [Thermaerobacter sp. PB12/4term]QIA27764.1 CapA family protein [Thermaerobacter sp. PB12/4term]
MTPRRIRTPMMRLAVLFAATLLVFGGGCGPLAEWAGLAPWGNPSAVDQPGDGPRGGQPPGDGPPGGQAPVGGISALPGAAEPAGPQGGPGGGRVLPGAGDELGPGDGPDGLAWQRASLASVGDVLIHNTLLAAARQKDGTYDFGPALAAVTPALRAADLAVANLEQPVTGADLGGYTGYPQFNSPPELLETLRQAGFDVLTNANNHTLDRGRRGVERTFANLERFGFIHAGTARNAEERDRIAVADAGGIRIAFLAYTYGTNGIPLPAPYLVNLIDPQQIAADIARARRAGVDLVSVSLHFGNEYETEPNRQQEDLVDQVLAAGADIVLGHHPHVLQRAELRPAGGAEGEAAPGEPGPGEQAGREARTATAGAPAGGAPAAGSDGSCTGRGPGQPAGQAGQAGRRPCLYKAVLFSQGNFLAGQIGEDRMTSALFWLDLARDPLTGRAGVTGIRYVPLYIHKGRVNGRWLWRPLPAREAAGDPARYQVPQADVPLLERAYRRALQRLEAPGVSWVPMEELAPAQGQ